MAPKECGHCGKLICAPCLSSYSASNRNSRRSTCPSCRQSANFNPISRLLKSLIEDTPIYHTCSTMPQCQKLNQSDFRKHINDDCTLLGEKYECPCCSKALPPDTKKYTKRKVKQHLKDVCPNMAS